MIKAVVWDLDRTLLDGVMLESVATPTKKDGVDEIIARLHERGIVNSIASRNPTETAEAAVASLEWPAPFIAPQYGWGDKSESLKRIASHLDIELAALAFVDDDPYERAEVAAHAPQVLVLSPEDVAGALDWPQFSPRTVTAEARGRAQSYLDIQERERAAREFTGTRADFQRYCGTRITIRRAGQRDVARFSELSLRTTQFNSRGMGLSESDVAEGINADDRLFVCIELGDRFGDDGVIGGIAVTTCESRWRADLVMMSCRAMGRGVIEAALTWLAGAARDSGAGEVIIPLRPNERNVPLRLALVADGYRAHKPTDGVADFARRLGEDEGELDEWVKVDT